jgi:Holliday junction resolvase
MTASERQKGLRGEQRVSNAYREAGWDVRRLAGLGDFLAFKKGERPHHVEVKNQKRLQVPLWLDQVRAEVTPGHVPVVVFPDRYGKLWLCQPVESLSGLEP